MILKLINQDHDDQCHAFSSYTHEGVEESPIFHCLQFISVDGFLIDEKRQRGVLNLVIDALDSLQNGPGLSTEVFKLES